MDTEKIIRLGHEIQAELQLDFEKGITNQEQYGEVLKLVHILADDDVSYNKNWALLDVLTPLIERYDDKQDHKIAMERSKTAKIIKVDINDLK